MFCVENLEVERSNSRHLSTWFGFDNNRCSIECVPSDLGTGSKLCTRCNHGFGHKSEHHSTEVGIDGGK